VKVLGTGLSGRGSVFAAGLRWAIENGMEVCNLSLGTTKRDFFTLCTSSSTRRTSPT